MIYLTSPRLILRSLCEADLDAFAAYRSDPETARYQGWEAPYSREQAADLVAEMRRAPVGTPGVWHQVGVERRDPPGIIGDVAFQVWAEDARQAWIGFTLAPAYRGQGYATEAVRRLLDYLFYDLRLHRVMATCDVENLASACLLERVGMRREAHLIENIWFKGAWGSEYLYAILEREWRGM